MHRGPDQAPPEQRLPSGWGVVFAASALVAVVDCGSNHSRHGDRALVLPVDQGRVVGRLLDSNTNQPLSHWTVAIDRQRTGTAADGAFVFTDIAQLYDVAVLAPDRSSVVIYRGLTRRDPRLLAGHAESDLRSLGAPECGDPALDDEKLPRAERCGDGGAYILALPTVLLTPTDGEAITYATEFSWAGLDRGVSLLRLVAQTPSRETPNIDVYTADTSVRWPDLRWLGIAFPSPPTTYGCRIAVRDTFAGIDEAVGPRGLVGPWRAGTRVAASASIVLRVPEPAPRIDNTVAEEDGADEATSGPPVKLVLARRVSGQKIAADKSWSPTQLLVGERWGCVELTSSEGHMAGPPVPPRWESDWQCWDASGPGALGARPRAWRVPWLCGLVVASGIDRICALDPVALTFRCWHRPVRGEARPREFPSSAQWFNPTNDPFGGLAYKDAIFVGGTFDCLRWANGEVRCSRDDSFGQLGTAGSPRSGSDAAVAGGLLGVTATTMSVGMWHACAQAGDELACWGRGDYGQLGSPANDRCTVRGQVVPCARTPQPGFAGVDPWSILHVGDLFTCVSDRQGIACWGANQDAFFGEPASFPDALRRSWPTLHGPVAAPRAACSTSPVRISGSGDFDAGPRGLCFDDGDDVQCIGAIPTPRGGHLAAPKVSPGQDASACALRNGAVSCWGEAYSPPGARATPVAIELLATPPIKEVAVVGGIHGSGWGDGCIAHDGCWLEPGRLAPCPKGLEVQDWSEVIASARTLVGTQVHVRGPLGVLSLHPVAASASCKPHCCHQMFGDVVLGGAAAPLGLLQKYCGGDESGVCCNAPAYGELVVASGQLQRGPSAPGERRGWMLYGVTLCSETLHEDAR
jgi:hypothetical protein